ncbi:TPA: hypothetical protein QCR75_005700 [Bacillus anthracis]|nr:hypothetical protein [Bacillus anthracis]
MIIENDVTEYLALDGWNIIEDIVSNLKNKLKSKNEIEAFEKLNGYDLIEHILNECTDKYINSINEDDAIDIIEEKLGLFI